MQLFQFLMRNAGLVLMLGLISRLPLFRGLFLGRKSGVRTELLFVVYWTLAALMATGISFGSAYVPLLAGRYGGYRAGLLVGLFTGTWLNFSSASVPSVLVHVLAGMVGGFLAGRLSLGGDSPAWLALLAGFLSLLGMDAPESAGTWLAGTVPLPLPGLIPLIYLTLAFSLADLVFIRLMEYLMAEGDRYLGHLSAQLLQLVDEAGVAFSRGMTPEAAVGLAGQLRRILEVPAVCVVSDHQVIAFDGAFAHLGEVQAEIPGPHQEVFNACPPGCPYGELKAFPIDERNWLGLLAHQGRPLLAEKLKAVSALATVLGGMLSRAKLLEQKAELESTRHRFLQAQIRPHFLFNALNTIASGADSETRDLVVHLSSFLRESFRREQAQATLEQELDLVESYLYIEQQRFGDRLRVVMETPDPLPHCQLPSFTLQPLVENAIHHGIGQAPKGGELRLRVLLNGDRVELVVADTGVGMTRERLEEVLAQTSDGENIGVANVRARLKAEDFKIESRPGRGTTIRFSVPVS